MSEVILYSIPQNVQSGIYKICAPENYYYIGSSNNIKARYLRHYHQLKNNKHRNTHMQNRYNKHMNNWSCVLIEQVASDKHLLLEREQHYLNISKGDVLRMNINDVAGRGPDRRGVKVSAHTRELLRQANIGKVMSKKVREKISRAMKGRPLTETHRLNMVGRKQSEQTRAKIGSALTGHRHSSTTKAKISKSRKQYWKDYWSPVKTDKKP